MKQKELFEKLWLAFEPEADAQTNRAMQTRRNMKEAGHEMGEDAFMAMYSTGLAVSVLKAVAAALADDSP